MARKRTQKNPKSLLKLLKNNLTAFVTGAVILVIVVLLALGFAKNKTFFVNKKSAENTQGQMNKGKYVVKAGDHLWKIAESAYGSGYNAYDIAQANNLQNPDVVEVGKVLELPQVTSRSPTRGDLIDAQATNQVTLNDSVYTVKSGDHLWKIAQDAYGDPYMWPKIAQANKLTDPNLIHPGNRLAIPRT